MLLITGGGKLRGAEVDAVKYCSGSEHQCHTFNMKSD
jgi:hypothetical protein